MATRQQILDNLADIPPMEIAEAISENVVTLYELSRTGKLMPRKKRLILEAYDAIKAGRLSGPKSEPPTIPAAEGPHQASTHDSGNAFTSASTAAPSSETSSVPTGAPTDGPVIEPFSEPTTGPSYQQADNKADLPYDPFAPSYPSETSNPDEPEYQGDTTYTPGQGYNPMQPGYTQQPGSPQQNGYPTQPGYKPPLQLNYPPQQQYAEKPAMFQNPFSFGGRIRRTEYGICYALYLFGIISFRLCVAAYGQRLNDDVLLAAVITVGVLLIPLYWLIIAQSVKRCHDLGKSGWWILIPLYNPFALLFGGGEQGPNQYGMPAK